jgi:hypothetical protein
MARKPQAACLAPRRLRPLLPGGAALLLLGSLLLPRLSLPARAQSHGPALKTVHGSVLNKDEDPLPEAIVFLKHLQSGTIKTYIADSQGEYHFTGLDPNADYEIHAEYKGDSSPARRLSSLDGRKDIHLNLVIVHKK